MDRPSAPTGSRASDVPAIPRAFGRRPPGSASPASRLALPAHAATPRVASPAPPVAASAPPEDDLQPSLFPPEVPPAEEAPAVAAPTAPRESFDPPPLPPRADIAAIPARPRHRRAIGLLLLLVGASALYFMQSSKAGPPECGGADATALLRQMSRESLAKQNIVPREIQFSEIAPMTPDGDGFGGDRVSTCRAVLEVDGQPMANLVYRIAWKLRLVIYNRYDVKVLTATAI